MPISFDTSADLGSNGGGSATLSKAYTNNGNTIYVGFTGDNALDDINSVTYAGGTLQPVSKLQNIGERFAYLYVLKNCPTGAGTITITANSTHYLAGVAASYFNGGNIDNAGSVTKGTVSSLTGTVTTSQVNDWVVGYVNANLGTVSAGASTTLRQANAGFPNLALFDSNGSVLTIGNTTLVANDNTSNNMCMVLSSLTQQNTGGMLQSDI